ncbi:MarR family winged helix-turn-helix transcriptional regulator [Actinotalea sp. AC32]|nr:MarR family winged helix-turn-helix transcriptional regulator [Actinotalea sp. AC32]
MTQHAGGDVAAAEEQERPVVGATPSAEPVPARWLSAEQQRHWRAYLLGSARLQEALNRQLEDDADMSLSEYEILVRLSEVEDRTVRMSELAASVMHSRSRLTHTVSRMERRGLVVRTACADDRRGVNCTLTDTGYALLERTAPGHVEAVRRNLVDLLTDDQFRALGAVMGLVAEGPADDGAPRPGPATARG